MGVNYYVEWKYVALSNFEQGTRMSLSSISRGKWLEITACIEQKWIFSIRKVVRKTNNSLKSFAAEVLPLNLPGSSRHVWSLLSTK